MNDDGDGNDHGEHGVDNVDGDDRDGDDGDADAFFTFTKLQLCICMLTPLHTIDCTG